jgi:hypothetical protein
MAAKKQGISCFFPQEKPCFFPIKRKPQKKVDRGQIKADRMSPGC